MVAFTWAAIHRWNEGHFTDAVDDMRLLRQTALDAQKDVETNQRNFASTGRTADAVRSRQDRLVTYLSGIVQESSDIMMALADAADGVWEVRTRITDCEQYAESRQLTLDPQTGEVSYTIDDLIPQDTNGNPMYRAADSVKISVRRNAADTLRNMVDQTLTRAQEVNDDLIAKLKKLGQTAPGHRQHEHTSTHSPGLPNLPQSGWSSTEVATWWGTLSDTDKQWLLDHHPHTIGNLDGVEFTWRDKVNRKILDELITQYSKAYENGKDYIAKLDEPRYAAMPQMPFNQVTKAHAAKKAAMLLTHLNAVKRSLQTDDSQLVALD